MQYREDDVEIIMGAVPVYDDTDEWNFLAYITNAQGNSRVPIVRTAERHTRVQALQSLYTWTERQLSELCDTSAGTIVAELEYEDY